MNILKTALIAALLATGLACGYSSKASTPPAVGTKPAISALSPNSTPAGSPGVVLTVNGSGFNGNATINWGSTVLTTNHVSANQLTANVPNSDVAAAGMVAVTVTNPGTPGGIYGGGTMAETSNSMTFTIN